MKDDWQAGRKKRKRSRVNYCWITITHLLMNFNELTVLTGFDLMIRKDSCLPNDLHKYIHDVRWSIIRSHHQQMDLLVVKPFEVCSNLVVFNETRKMLGFYFDRKLEQEQELVFLWWTGDISSCFHGSKEDISDERSPVVMCEASESWAMLLVTTLGVFNGACFGCFWQDLRTFPLMFVATKIKRRRAIYSRIIGDKEVYFWWDVGTFSRRV